MASNVISEQPIKLRQYRYSGELLSLFLTFLFLLSLYALATIFFPESWATTVKALTITLAGLAVFVQADAALSRYKESLRLVEEFRGDLSRRPSEAERAARGGLEGEVERIKAELGSSPVVLFMKGTPDFPQCGFSAQTVAALRAVGAEFSYVNIFEEPEMREALKRLSNWPTYPQLYVKGELIGGCDIALEMYKSGELKKLLAEIGAAK